LVAVAVALVVAVAMAMTVEVARVRVRVVALAMKVAVMVVWREMAVAVVVVVAVVVEVEAEVVVTGGVPFGPHNGIKITSTLDNMLVHLILIISLLILYTRCAWAGQTYFPVDVSVFGSGRN
jgi:hypothetical protein